MKKITLLLISIISIGLTTVSCSKKDSETSIEGKWVINKEGKIINGQEVLTTHIHATGCQKDYTIFNADGTAKDYDFTKFEANCNEQIVTYTYSRSGDKLTATFGGTSNTATISVSDSELKVIAIDDDGTNVAIFNRE